MYFLNFCFVTCICQYFCYLYIYYICIITVLPVHIVLHYIILFLYHICYICYVIHACVLILTCFIFKSQFTDVGFVKGIYIYVCVCVCVCLGFTSGFSRQYLWITFCLNHYIQVFCSSSLFLSL
jgi:hypothetical protein